jgi:hypothetical protein
MRRYHEERALIRRHHREHVRGLHAQPPGLVGGHAHSQVGRFRKSHAHGFRLRRLLHHLDKVAGVPRRQETLAEKALREEIQELWEDLLARRRYY